MGLGRAAEVGLSTVGEGGAIATAGTLREPLRDGILGLGFSPAAVGVAGFSADMEDDGVRADEGFVSTGTSTFKGNESVLGVLGSVLPRARPLAPRPPRPFLLPPRPPPRSAFPPLAFDGPRKAGPESVFLRLLRSLGRADGGTGVAVEGLGAARVAGVAIIQIR